MNINKASPGHDTRSEKARFGRHANTHEIAHRPDIANEEEQR